MSASIEYYDDVVECINCGVENVVNIISEYDTKSGETFNDVAGLQLCTECGYELNL